MIKKLSFRSLDIPDPIRLMHSKLSYDEYREVLPKIEKGIITLSGYLDDDDDWWPVRNPNLENLSILFNARASLMNNAFNDHCTKEEILRFREVNGSLRKLRDKMGSRAAALYRRFYLMPRDLSFDDQLYIDGKISVCKVDLARGKGVLRFADDSYYCSDFYSMIDINTDLIWTSDVGIDGLIVYINDDMTPGMSDRELGFKEVFEFNQEWGFQNITGLKDIIVCRAAYTILTEYGYSIPDFLRMNEFDVTVGVGITHLASCSECQ